MSDKNKPEELKALEPILDETPITDSPIANPSDQSAWNKSQEAHKLDENESATHIGLQAGDLQKLQAEGRAEKFELFDSSLGPLEDIKIEGTVSDQFLKELRAAIKQIPENERRLLAEAGVKIVAKDVVSGHAGSPAIYEPDSKRIVIGMTGFLGGGDSASETNQTTWGIKTKNHDVAGSFKHETGHAMYEALRLGQNKELKDVIALERGIVREADKEALTHLLEDDSEIFAEAYAFMKGRESPRVGSLVLNFPRTIVFMDEMMQKNPELNP